MVAGRGDRAGERGMRSKKQRAGTAFARWRQGVAETERINHLSRPTTPAKPRPATPRFWRASDVQVSAAVARREAKSNDA